MRQCIFVTIQLHLSHTLVECETKFLNAACTDHHTMWTFRPKKDIVTLLSGHPSGDTQLLILGTVSFTHTKRRGVSVQVTKSTNKNNISIGISSLCQQPYYVFHV